MSDCCDNCKHDAICSHCEEVERCEDCYSILDEDGECECRPEGYVSPGSEALLYVNAYEVTRHYGGREEGGWWYNHSEPIASIPIRAVSTAGHGNYCHQCFMARQNAVDSVDSEDNAKTYKMCKWGFELAPANQEQLDMFVKHLEDLYADVKEGDIYSVLGGTDVHVCVEDHPGERTPRPHYE